MSLEQIAWEQGGRCSGFTKNIITKRLPTLSSLCISGRRLLGTSIELEEDFFAVKAEKRGGRYLAFPFAEARKQKKLSWSGT